MLLNLTADLSICYTVDADADVVAVVDVVDVVDVADVVAVNAAAFEKRCIKFFEQTLTGKTICLSQQRFNWSRVNSRFLGDDDVDLCLELHLLRWIVIEAVRGYRQLKLALIGIHLTL